MWNLAFAAIKLRAGTVEKDAVHYTNILNQHLPGSLFADCLADPRVLIVGSFKDPFLCLFKDNPRATKSSMSSKLNSV